MHRRNPSMDYTGAPFSLAALFSIPLARFVRQGETRERPSDTKEEGSPRISLDAQSGPRLPCNMPYSDECRVVEVPAESDCAARTDQAVTHSIVQVTSTSALTVNVPTS